MTFASPRWAWCLFFLPLLALFKIAADARAREVTIVFAASALVISEHTVARHLQKHPRVAWVNYPGLEDNKYYALARKYMPSGAGALVTFGIKGGYDAGKVFILEVNPNPDFSPMAGLSGGLQSAGLTHAGFTVQLVEAALARGRSAGFGEAVPGQPVLG